MEHEPLLKLPPLETFNYAHGGRVLLSKPRKLAFFVSLMFALICVKILFPFGFLALALPAYVYLGGVRTLKIGPRYLICGERIVYYANVKRLVHDEVAGTLNLIIGLKTNLLIERKRFKGGAGRGKDKGASFAEVAAMVSERVRQAAPEALEAPDEANEAASAAGDAAKTRETAGDAALPPSDKV